MSAMKETDKDFYARIFSDKSLMYYINTDINTLKIHRDFKALCNESSKRCPDYLCYVIRVNLSSIGLFSIKKSTCNEIEVGVIILNEFQQQGWSKKIHQFMVNFIFESLKPQVVMAYCNHKNKAANQLYETLGFSIKKQFKHKVYKYLMYKWVVTEPIEVTPPHKDLELCK